MQVRAKQIQEGEVPCGCGRSPTGYCIGWHGLSETEFKERLTEYELRLQEDQASSGE